MFKVTAYRRDLIFFLLLFIMIKVALNKKQLPQADPSLYAPANLTDTDEAFFHPPDQQIMHQLDTLSNQVDKATQALDASNPEKSELKKIQSRLTYLRRKYEHTSPAIALLGPIGSAGIVLQEQRLEKELVEIEENVTDLLS